ncbi:bifunctional Syntaxin 6 [Babesia duncani]|uniref:Bifunctional Syntaxin 6 n=1 Tax=Babesia duncani TaxID=323732 RepID=A0AAD9PLQ3_9APIC|nr:bifunctional Syntaxin 6 [Babesia duncani]
MEATSSRARDPYDEAESKVRKNIRKIIVLQSQAIEELRNAPPNSTLESIAKGRELLTICNGIESDISELQKVIAAIKENPSKYKIPTPVFQAREATIEEFKSKIKGVRDRNALHMAPRLQANPQASGIEMQHQQQLMEDQDTQLGVLAGTAASIFDNAKDIHMQVTTHNRMLQDLEGGMTETQAHIGSIAKRMALFLDTNNPSLIRLVLYLCGIAILLLIVIIIF